MEKIRCIELMEHLKRSIAIDGKDLAFYCDVLDMSQPYALAVYRSPNKHEVGIYPHDPITNSNFSIRLRVGDDSVEAEELAFELYRQIKSSIQAGTEIGKKICFAHIEGTEPERVGWDDNGIVEYLMEVIIYHYK